MTKEVTLEVAEKMLDTAERWASNFGNPCCIAVVDRAGAVVAFHRMDNCPIGPMISDIAINKAFAAVQFGGSTYLLSKMLDPRANTGEIIGSYYIGLLTQLKGRLNCIPGGEPIRNAENEVIGGIGVAGLPDGVGEISDTTVCQAGISALYK